MEPIQPPADDGPCLLYNGLWYRLPEYNFNAAQWSESEIVPTDRDGPFLFYRGTFYQAGLTDETKARLGEPFLELAAAIGKTMAKQAYKANREKTED